MKFHNIDKKKVKHERGMVESSLIMAQNKHAEFNEISVDNAVKHGYSISHHIYNACNIIINQLSSVPFIVKNKDGEKIPNHPIEQLLKNPHPELTRTQFMQLMGLFMLLSGTSYIHKVKGFSKTNQLWLINPDRIAPVGSVKNDQIISRYKIKNKSGSWVDQNNFKPENTFRCMFVSPSEPLKGISPLQALARTVELDNTQRQQQYNSLKDGGMVPYILSYDQEEGMEEADVSTIWEKMKKWIKRSNDSNVPLVLGGKVSVHKIGLSSKELDYLESLKINKEDIYTTFGVPAPLYQTESQTYSNFSDSMRILWEMRVLPMLDLIIEQFNRAFEDELGDAYVSFDKSKIDALSDNQEQIAKMAKGYYDMGVPVKQINDKLELGFEEFDNWDKPFSGTKPTSNSSDNNERSEDSKKKVIETRKAHVRLRSVEEQLRLQGKIQTRADGEEEITSDAKLQDKLMDKYLVDEISEILENNQEALYEYLGDGVNFKENEIKQLCNGYTGLFKELFDDRSVKIARAFYDTVAVNTRAGEVEEEKALIQKIQDTLGTQAAILADCEAITALTAETIILQLQESKVQGETIKEFKERINDTGVFSPARSLRIARTEAGTWSSFGQQIAGEESGAVWKRWLSSGFKVRQIHKNRDGERVPIDGRYSTQGTGYSPKMPCDPNMDARDRINCRCSQVFE